jgi:hypothetical protein
MVLIFFFLKAPAGAFFDGCNIASQGRDLDRRQTRAAQTMLQWLSAYKP